MGIPSYFSQLVKNNPRLLFELEKLEIPVDNFYLDCNSIIYDTIRRIENDVTENIEEKLMCCTCEQILNYINTISPQNRVFIAFDGVAPIAKLEQQRNRRFKSRYEKSISQQLGTTTNNWDTAKITPGTKFMTELANYVENYFKVHNLEGIEVIISTSNDAGEGEHKLYEYIRNNDHSKETTLIYGVDADLIMLSLNHIHLCKNIYLYRETPFFIKSLNNELEPEQCYILDIPRLSRVISSQLEGKHDSTRDYIFMCFLLGNDFLPHFPSLNIRTKGIEILLRVYSRTFKNTSFGLTDGSNINWHGLNLFITALAKMEKNNIRDEYQLRSRWEKRPFASKTNEDKLIRFSHLPIKLREVEKYISPDKERWRERYYSQLLGCDPSNYYVKRICTNYFEGLEWTLRYYTKGCCDWRWKYNYSYPPLLTDLVNHIPKVNLLTLKEKSPISSTVQLAYVLPKNANYLLNEKIRKKLEDMNIYSQVSSFKWSFCKYFWESHAELPFINIALLEKELNILIKNKK